MSGTLRTVCVLIAICSGTSSTITWTGLEKDGVWQTAQNWYPANVPTAADDVVINDASGADTNITVVGTVLVQSLTVGTGSNVVNLQLLGSLSASKTFTVGGKGTIIVGSGGNLLGSPAPVQIGGALNVAGGDISGTVNANGDTQFTGILIKTLRNAKLTVTSPSKSPLLIEGAVHFYNSSISSDGALAASSKMFQFQNMDNSQSGFFSPQFKWSL